MALYQLSDNSADESRWPVAVAIHPRSHVVKWACQECGRAARYPARAFDVTIEGGIAFPDFLGCGEYPFLIVSHKVVVSWQAAGVDSFHAYPVAVIGADDSSLIATASPKYYRIDVTGRFMVNFCTSGITIKEFCRCCGEVTRHPFVKPLKPLEGSWDGSSLFCDERFFPAVTFCSEIVKTTAQLHGHTNVRFDLID